MPFASRWISLRNSRYPIQGSSRMVSMQNWGSSHLQPGERLMLATDMMAGLQPTNATEALLAVQMAGVHNAAVKFLASATSNEQTSGSCDANVLRATRLMRLFNEQAKRFAHPIWLYPSAIRFRVCALLMERFPSALVPAGFGPCFRHLTAGTTRS